MAKVLQNFLIGVGLDTEVYDKGAKKVEFSLGRMRSLVGLTGAAIAGAFGAAGAAAVAAGQRVDQGALKFEKLKTARQYVVDYGRALAALGGNADDAYTAINSIEEAQANLKLKGQLGPLEDVALARGDIDALMKTGNGKDFLRTLAPMVQNMSKDQQRLVQDALHLPDAVMRSLRGGVDQLDFAIARAHELAGNFDSATESARDFNKELAEFDTRLERIGNTLAEKVLPGFTGILQSADGFLDRHKDTVDSVAQGAGEHPMATALMTGGGAASAAGVALRGIGLRGLGVGLSRLGYPGMIAGGGLLAYDAAKDWTWGDWWKQSTESATDSWRNWTGQNDQSALPDAPVGSAVPDVAPGSITPAEALPTNPNAYGAVGGPGLRMRPEALPANPAMYGYVTPAEGASVNPDVVMIRDQREQAGLQSMPPRVDVQNHLDVRMELDGRAFDKRVTEVVERREQTTQDDIMSSVNR
ncbi:hypothetical protein [Castellaniella sp. UC4442_H9]